MSNCEYCKKLLNPEKDDKLAHFSCDALHDKRLNNCECVCCGKELSNDDLKDGEIYHADCDEFEGYGLDIA